MLGFIVNSEWVYTQIQQTPQTPQTEQQIMMGDINQDGTVNVVDIVLLISIILGALFN